MAMISKEIFDRFVTRDMNCNLIHPHTDSCLEASFYFLKNACIGLNKFFLPIYLLQMVLSGKKIDRVFLMKHLKAYKRTIFYGILFVMLFVTTNCWMRQLLGKFHYSIIGYFCGFVAGLPIFIESPENRLMNTLIFSSLGIEALIRNLEWFKIIERTPKKETLAFMVASGILMRLLETQKINVMNIWFFHPSKNIKWKPDDCEAKDVCYHGKLDCVHFISNELIKYFGFGYALEMVKFSVTNFNKIITKPNLLLKMVTSKKNVLFGATIGGYVAIYRLVSCLLFKYDKKKIFDYHSLVAGTLSGVTYLIKPNLQFLSLAVVTIIQLLIQKLRRYVPLSNHFIGVIFALLNGILLHNRFFHVRTCPNYTKNMVSVCTNGVADNIYANLLNIFPTEVLFSKAVK